MYSVLFMVPARFYGQYSVMWSKWIMVAYNRGYVCVGVGFKWISSASIVVSPIGVLTNIVVSTKGGNFLFDVILYDQGYLSMNVSTYYCVLYFII